MRAGDVINGYTILEDFRVVGAGLSKWTFAANHGRQYFIKEFLSPTYPDEHAPGSAQTKMRKRQRCAAFERHHRRIQQALTEVSGLGGQPDRHPGLLPLGGKYYKVTEKVDVAGLEPGDVTTLPPRTSWSCSRRSPTACGSCTTAASSMATSSRATSSSSGPSSATRPS